MKTGKYKNRFAAAFDLSGKVYVEEAEVLQVSREYDHLGEGGPQIITLQVAVDGDPKGWWDPVFFFGGYPHKTRAAALVEARHMAIALRNALDRSVSAVIMCAPAFEKPPKKR